MKKETTSSDIYVDPVCLMKVDPSKHKLRSTYQGCTYFFCAEACRKAFESTPVKYVRRKSDRRKGIWGRYLERLNKTTGGKPMKCH